ncbi:PRC-barrel domain-containing protein [Jatrophihabitans fulvus]
MLFTEVDGRKVVSTSSAETVGKVDEFVVDPSTRKVVALRLKKTDSGDTLTWQNITAVGGDAITVAEASLITEADQWTAELAHKDRRALGKRVLTTAGDEIGKLADVDFDPAGGTITALRVGDRDVPGDALVGIGSYAVVVRA